VRFDPCDFLGRLAVLVPRPRVNLLFYHGVLGARSAWRRAIVPGTACGASEAPAAAAESAPTDAPTPRGRRWADLMQRSFGFDVLACDRCGGRLRLIALIQQADVIRRILTHLGLPIPITRDGSPPYFAMFSCVQRIESFLTTEDAHWRRPVVVRISRESAWRCVPGAGSGVVAFEWPRARRPQSGHPGRGSSGHRNCIRPRCSWAQQR
jgi:hypothetical protein